MIVSNKGSLLKILNIYKNCKENLVELGGNTRLTDDNSETEDVITVPKTVSDVETGDIEVAQELFY